MSSIISHCLYVVCGSVVKVSQAHEMAKEIFNPKDQSENLVSHLNLTSFFVLCNGSHTRLEDQEEYMKAREKYINYLKDRDIHFVEATRKSI
ncbi:hypothetical protein [Bacillus cereus]|uniref:Uncharacterized protein n=1 Tax=Bacillus cereus TaxID=1396 RepID=A0A2B9DUU9_BACCE|nr:hypothetical protein [Bacillus cereus]PGM92620.1 hypothetical protein CN958_15195 [Bacillus cereus]